MTTPNPPDPASGWPDPSPGPAPPPPPGWGPPHGWWGQPPLVAVPGYGYPPPAATNGTAVGSMITSIISGVLLLCAVCLLPFAVLAAIGGVVGAILGHVARRQIRERGERGDGMALAGIIIGWIAGGIGAAAIVALLAWFGMAFRTDGW